MRSASLAPVLLLLAATACSEKPKAPPPPPAPVQVAPVTIVQPEPERAEADPAALARQLAALGAEPPAAAAAAAAAARPAPAARPAAPRRVIRPVEGEPETAAAPEPDNGMLTDAQFQATLGGWRGLKSCLAQQAGQQHEDTSGALKVEFVISGRGEVTTSKVYELSNDAAKEIADCVEREAKRVKFPAFTAADSVTKQAKFVF